MKTSKLIDMLHKNDIDAITSSEKLDFSIKYIRTWRGRYDIELSYYSNWENGQITVRPFLQFDTMQEAMIEMVGVIDKLKEDKK